MILPTEYLDLDSCVLWVATLIHERILEVGPVPLHELAAHIERQKGRSGMINFTLALTFLYAVGLLRYENVDDVVFITADLESAA